jgi:hypothetical protein
MTLNEKSDKKNKSIAFMSNTVEDDDQSESDFGGEFTEALALLEKKFNKAFKRLDRKSRPNVQDKSPDHFKRSDNFRNSGYQRKSRDEEKPSRAKGV